MLIDNLKLIRIIKGINLKKIILILLVYFSSLNMYGQNITGHWNGILKAQGIQLGIVFNINKTENGFSSTMDSPNQGASGIPVTTTSFKDSILILAITNLGIEYEGVLEKDDSIHGIFKQAGQSISMNLFQEKNIKEMTIIINENKDTNFVEEQVILQTLTGKIYGTLTIPKMFTNGPLVLIIAGSGPTDRDGNNPWMKCDVYKKLAYSLAENKIASLRYDKRGIAASQEAGKNEADLRFDDFVNDARGWLELLKKDKRFSKVIVLGHSEGSLIGMISSSTNAAKFISIAGAGQSADRILKEQLSTQTKEVQELSNLIIDSLKNGNKVDNVNPKLTYLFRTSVQPYIISWFKYDPQIEIQKLNIPILIIHGTNDIQVTVEDAKRLSKASPKSRLILIDKMNHILRIIDGDMQANIATYNDKTLPLSIELINEVTSFILKE